MSREGAKDTSNDALVLPHLFYGLTNPCSVLTLLFVVATLFTISCIMVGIEGERSPSIISKKAYSYSLPIYSVPALTSHSMALPLGKSSRQRRRAGKADNL